MFEKITYKNRTYFGALVIGIGIILFLLGNLDVYNLVILIPAILLCILKENKILGAICIVLSLLFILTSVLGILSADQMIIVNDYVSNSVDPYYNQMVFEIQISYLIKAIYGFVCLIASWMLFKLRDKNNE